MIVVDCETTGLNPERCSIISIGAVDFTDSNRQFYEECRIYPKAQIEEEALNINGFNIQELFDPQKPPEEDLIRHFLFWLNNSPVKILAGENPTFDSDFIKETAKRYSIEHGLGRRTIDLHTLSITEHIKKGVYHQIPLRNGRPDLTLDRTLIYVGLPEEPRPHNALTGAKLEAEAFSRLIHSRNLLEEYQHFPIPVSLLPLEAR